MYSCTVYLYCLNNQKDVYHCMYATAPSHLLSAHIRIISQAQSEIIACSTFTPHDQATRSTLIINFSVHALSEHTY